MLDQCCQLLWPCLIYVDHSTEKFEKLNCELKTCSSHICIASSPVQLGGLRDLIHHICAERSIHDGNLFFPSQPQQRGTVEGNLRVQRASRSTNSISFLWSQHSNRAITFNFPQAYFNLVFPFKLVLARLAWSFASAAIDCPNHWSVGMISRPSVTF